MNQRLLVETGGALSVAPGGVCCLTKEIYILEIKGSPLCQSSGTKPLTCLRGESCNVLAGQHPLGHLADYVAQGYVGLLYPGHTVGGDLDSNIGYFG